TWTQLTPTGTSPSPRTSQTAVYDPVRDRMLVFGGAGVVYTNDVFALTLAGTPAWSQLTPAGTPPSPRNGHAAIYDPLRDRMLVFGGFDGSLRNDVWALSLSGTPAWNLLNTGVAAPGPRTNHTAIYDAVGDRMVVFGGFDGSRRNDAWALALAGTPQWS